MKLIRDVWYRIIADSAGSEDDRMFVPTGHNLPDVVIKQCLNGEKVNEWPGDAEIWQDEMHDNIIYPDYLFSSFGLRVISPRFKEIFQKHAKGDAEYYEIGIKDRGASGSYFVMNVLTVVDALDLQASQLVIWDKLNENVLSVGKYALKKSRMQGVPLAVLKNDRGRSVWISYNLAKEIVGLKMTNVFLSPALMI